MAKLFSKFNIQDILDNDPDKAELHPHRAWLLMFVAEVVFIIVVLVLHIYGYYYMRTGRSYKTENHVAAMSGVKLNRNGLEEVTRMFEDKNKEFNDLLTSFPYVADPAEDASKGGSNIETPREKSITKNATTSPQDTLPVSF